jgi:VanZ family protein
LPNWRWAPFALAASVIWWASSQPVDGVPPIPHLDKVAHFVIFGLLALAARWPLLRRPLWTAWAFSAGYGVIDELHQYFGTAGRSAEFLDWVADALGAWLALTLAARMLRERPEEVEETG